MDQVNRLYGQDALVISNKRTRNKTELIVAVDLKEGAENALNEVQITTSERSMNNHDSGESFDDIMESKIFNPFLLTFIYSTLSKGQKVGSGHILKF
mgnify:CR=1 FL=1